MIPQLNLSQRIALGYFFILLISIGFGIFVLLKVSENRSGYQKLAEYTIPITEQLDLLKKNITEYNSLINSLTENANEAELNAIHKIHSEIYPEIRTTLKLLSTENNDPELNAHITQLLLASDQLFDLQSEKLQRHRTIKNKSLSNLSAAIPDSENQKTKLLSQESQVYYKINFIKNFHFSQINKTGVKLKAQGEFINSAIIFILLVVFIAGTISTIYTTRLLKKPIMYLKKTIVAMSKGEIPEIKISKRNDEVGLINNAFVELTSSLKKKAIFAVETGKGNYNVRLDHLGDKDELGHALAEMNKSLRIKAEAVQKENWLKSGIAQMSDILRNEHSNTGVLYKNIISFLSKYLVMNQGALYLIKEDREKIKYFELVAGYACDWNKTLNKRVLFSQGFVGQAATEKNILLIKDIPDDYLKINSGLGESSARHIIVVPLLFENELQGIVELASFSDINPLQVELLETLSSIIAATFDLINRKLHTELLLFESQDLNDKLIERENALQKSNEDLTEKGKQLRVSEEELREQQEELMQTNTQLEEKAQLLAEQNEEIRLKNEQLEVAKEAIHIKAEELENTSRYKSEFLANMSHELRTPLNSILILSNLLFENRDKNLNEKQVEYARVVKRSGTDLLNLINDILDLSKIESRKIELEIAEIHLKDLGSDIKSLFQELANDKKVNFSVNYGDNLPASIWSDKMRIEQVIKNLLSNSFKFTDKGGSVEFNIKRVTPEHIYNSSAIDPTRPMISLSVKDTGIGIPKDKQQLIFEAFKQADGSTSRKYGGTGLGLSISKELSIILGGEIQIESIPGSGSTFTLYLPVNLNDVSNAAENKSPEPKLTSVEPSNKNAAVVSSVIQQPKTDTTGTDKMILIIEDDEDFAKILLTHATNKGFKGMIATRGDTGLINARRFKPDAIILDLNLPGMDGWSVMRRIKEDPELQHIPVHIMSGHDDTQKAFPAGAVEILKKPVNNEQLNTIFENLDQTLARKLKSVLIIEDNLNQNESIKALLDNPNLDCQSAFSGKEAIEKLENGHFDLITLDLSLPDVSGFDLLKQIKSLEKFHQLPVIIYTGKNLTIEENRELVKYSASIIIKTEKSYERLVNETNLFLNKIVGGANPIENDKINPPSATQKSIQNQLPVVSDGSMKGKKVLLVDDDIRNIFAMTSILEQQECTVVVANDGKEALKMLDGNPDTSIVLMDIMMPEMDGYEAMKHIRAQEQHKQLPIVALTAKAMKGDKEKCFESGASDYISKPVDPVKLMSVMKILLYQ